MNIDGTQPNPGPAPTSRRPRPEAEKEVNLNAQGTTPIWSTHYIDPALSSSLVLLPPQITAAANAAFSAASSGKRKRFSTTTGAPLDGVARELKEWIVPPDGRFIAEHGPVEISLGVVDSGMEGWGKEKARKKARIDVVTKAGSVKVDIVSSCLSSCMALGIYRAYDAERMLPQIEIDMNRQIDMRVETKAGDVLILLYVSCFPLIETTQLI